MEDLVLYAIEAASAKGADYAEARIHVDSASAFTLTNGLDAETRYVRY